MTAPASGYTLQYRLRNHDLADPTRAVEVHASPEEINAFARDGYLVRERLFHGEQLERGAEALDAIVAVESRDPGAERGTSRSFGGLFLRHLMDKHQDFLDLLRYQPLLSVARAMLGPQVQVRGLSARVIHPGLPGQETHWHFHQRLIPDPVPPFFSRPQTIDALIYIDDADDRNGPLLVVPGSHERTDEDLAAGEYDDLPGQVTLRLPAGSVAMCHGALWHRAMPNTADGTVRRLLLLGYGPTWMKQSIYGTRPENGLTTRLLETADAETRELLGVAGYM
jgi:ectoine hydroxylase-related dioxygenase (phytanoyl-CoA dioxygenase family)